MNLVLIGSLVAARRSDSRATASVTPSTSKSTLAGRMTATQDSSGPLPLPMRVSSGFLVYDLSGKIRIHTLPRRFIKRVTATRAASICLVSSQQRSSACKPYSPNATVWPREAIPERLPRCILRYLTLAGIIGITTNLQLSGGCGLYRLRLFLFCLALADPALHSQFAVNRVRFGEPVINIRPQRMQRHPAFMVHFHAGQFRPAQTPRAPNLDALSAEIHCRLQGLLHGAAE